MAKKAGMSEEELIATAPLTVITRGDQGSSIYSSETGSQGVDIPIVPAREVRDPTGAGDAYVAGLVFGLARKLPLDVTGRIAALTAVFAVEERGCQEHAYTPSEFVARYTEVFGPNELVEQTFVGTSS
jgi:adenosine kinase